MNAPPLVTETPFQPQLILTLTPQAEGFGVQISLLAMPDGWLGALKVLGTAVQIAATQLAQTVEPQQIQLVQQMPKEVV